LAKPQLRKDLTEICKQEDNHEKKQTPKTQRRQGGHVEKPKEKICGGRPKKKAQNGDIWKTMDTQDGSIVSSPFHGMQRRKKQAERPRFGAPWTAQQKKIQLRRPGRGLCSERKIDAGHLPNQKKWERGKKQERDTGRPGTAKGGFKSPRGGTDGRTTTPKNDLEEKRGKLLRKNEGSPYFQGWGFWGVLDIFAVQSHALTMLAWQFWGGGGKHSKGDGPHQSSAE